MKTQMKSIATMAWMLVKKYGFTFSEGMKRAWMVAKLKARMNGGVVKFIFNKMDGSVRTAWGTLKSGLVPATTETRKPNDSLVTYFDTEKDAWRCFKIANLVSVA